MKGQLAEGLRAALRGNFDLRWPWDSPEAKELCGSLVTVMLEKAGTDSCFVRAGDDEPLFVLRAHDRTAPATVRDWCYRAKALGARPEKVESAMDWAIEMERWQKEHLPKTPD